MSRLTFAPTLTLSFTLALSMAACGHDHEEDPVAEACEHLKGPPSGVIASATATGAPEVRADHKRYEVKLADAASGKAGVVSFTSAQKGHMLVFLAADVPLDIKTSTGLPATLNASTKTGFPCTELKASYEYEVGIGRYDFTLGGATNTIDTVGVVIEAETHEH